MGDDIAEFVINTDQQDRSVYFRIHEVRVKYGDILRLCDKNR